MGPPAGTSRSTREDHEVEGAQKQQKETALLQGPMPQLLRPPETMGTLCSQSRRPLSQNGVGAEADPLYWPRSSPELFLHSSLFLELAPCCTHLRETLGLLKEVLEPLE